MPRQIDLSASNESITIGEEILVLPTEKIRRYEELYYAYYCVGGRIGRYCPFSQWPPDMGKLRCKFVCTYFFLQESFSQNTLEFLSVRIRGNTTCWKYTTTILHRVKVSFFNAEFYTVGNGDKSRTCYWTVDHPRSPRTRKENVIFRRDFLSRFHRLLVVDFRTRLDRIIDSRVALHKSRSYSERELPDCF